MSVVVDDDDDDDYVDVVDDEALFKFLVAIACYNNESKTVDWQTGFFVNGFIHSIGSDGW